MPLYNPVFASGEFLCPPTSYAPASPASLTTTSATLAAVSSANINTGSFIAPASGSVLVTANPQVTPAGVGLNWSFALAAHGTVTPLFGDVYTGKDGSTSTQPPRPVEFLVGLTPGASYNFDLLFATATGGTLTVTCVGQSSVTPTGTIGSPLVMKVQAV